MLQLEKNLTIIHDAAQASNNQAPIDLQALKNMVPTDAVLDSLGIPVNTRTHRAPCPVHGGNNPSAFAWTEAGLWHCHSCNAGGDAIELIRRVKGCSFKDAVSHLANVSGVTVAIETLGPGEIEKRRKLRANAKGAALDYYHAIITLRGEAGNRLRRCERLTIKCRNRLNAEKDPDRRKVLWTVLGTLEPMLTEFEATYDFLFSAKADDLITHILAAPAERREMIWRGGAA
jgi:hypothetical protein